MKSITRWMAYLAAIFAIHTHMSIKSVYNTTQVGKMGAICMPQADGGATFEVTSTTLHLIHSRGLYGGLEHEDS